MGKPTQKCLVSLYTHFGKKATVSPQRYSYYYNNNNQHEPTYFLMPQMQTDARKRPFIAMQTISNGN